jgi:hypothetical protein
VGHRLLVAAHHGPPYQETGGEVSVRCECGEDHEPWQHQEEKVSGDITSIIRENRYLKEQLEYKDWECKEMHDRVKFLEEEVKKLRVYVTKSAE